MQNVLNIEQNIIPVGQSAGILLLAALIQMLLVRLIRVPKRLESRRAKTYIAALHNTISVVVFCTAIYFILIRLGINVTPLLASAGVVGVVVGLGSRSLIADFIAGLFLLTEDSIRIGDSIKIGVAEGTVETIRLRTLSLRDSQGAVHIIPNGEIKTVVNKSRGTTHMIIDIPAKPSTKIDTVLSALKSCLTLLQKEKAFKNEILPSSGVRGIESITKDAVIVRTVIDTRSSRRFDIARHYRYLVKKTFEKKKIQVA